MKSLWIVNKCCGALHQHIFGKKATGGLWLDATLEDARNYPEDQIVVVNVLDSKKTYDLVDGNVHYYTIKGLPNEKYNYRTTGAVVQWKKILDTEKPDIIHIWGVEFPYSLAAIAAAPQIPTVVFVQGILESIGKHYLSGLTETELRQAISLRDILTGQTIKKTKRDYEKRTAYEAEIIRHSGHVLIENQWAYAYSKKMHPTVTAHFCPISISESFAKQRWQEENMQPHTIFCPAANYPIKGLHILLKALKIVKGIYPDVKLYIPGTKLRKSNSLRNRLKQNGYEKLIQQMIEDNGLESHIFYTGRLTADEMAQRMAESNCFVMSSAIENHSSTLKEAMMVGVPSVASFVGGVSQYAVHGENCLLYRFEDYEVLALDICRLFEEKELREKLSRNAAAAMRQPKEKSDYGRLSEIYNVITKGECQEKGNLQLL